LHNAGFEIRAKSVNPAVKDRVASVNKALEAGRLMVNEQACPVTARCLEQQAYDKNGIPDKTSGNDHQNDATGYPIAYEMPLVKPVSHIPVTFAL
ncbi:terminase, partial [Salmonella enterica subsp. enterica serovar Enteritidis]